MTTIPTPSQPATGYPQGGRIARALAAIVLVPLAVLFSACGDSPSGIDTSIRVDTTTLAGTWKGSIDGSGGFSFLTTQLNADSTMSGEGTTTFYCRSVGTWTVSGNRYTATGRICDGSIVTSVAPFNKLRLSGTWTATNGTSGTFILVKQ